MSTGTEIIHEALQEIGAHSDVAPASSASVTLGMKKLNSMLESWLSQGINVGFTPLSVPGDDLDESPSSRGGIVYQLALRLAGPFDNGKNIVSQDLRRNARIEFQVIKNLYKRVTVPEKVVSSTLPVGAGNSKGTNRRVFFKKGGTVTDATSTST
jgi:hypothetical protein